MATSLRGTQSLNLYDGNEWSRTTFCCVIKTTTSDNHSHLFGTVIFNDDTVKHLKCLDCKNQVLLTGGSMWIRTTTSNRRSPLFHLPIVHTPIYHSDRNRTYTHTHHTYSTNHLCYYYDIPLVKISKSQRSHLSS